MLNDNFKNEEVETVMEKIKQSSYGSVDSLRRLGIKIDEDKLNDLKE